MSTELPGYGAFLVETLVILAIVCALAWLILKYGVRRGRLFGAGGAGGMLKVVARLPLEPRRTLYVVEAPGKTLLIGVSEGAIATLAEIDGAQVAEALAAAAAGADGPAGGRKSFLEVLRGRRRGA